MNLALNSRRPGAVSMAEMLPEEPPPIVIRWTATLLIVLFAVVLTAALIVRVPETVRCTFLLVSGAGADPLQSPILAVVEKVNAVEGQEVEQNAELMVLRPDEVRGWQTQQRRQREDLKVRKQRAALMEELYRAQADIKREELLQAEQEVGFREKHVATSRNYLERMAKLAEAGLLSQVELLQTELKLAESEKDLNVAQKTQQQVTLGLKQLETDRLRHQTEEEGDMVKLQLSIDALTRQLENCTGDILTVRAPFAGVVISLAHR